MKKIISFLFIVFSFCAHAQVPEPAMLSLKGIGGSADDGIGTNVTKTVDGGFIIGLGTISAAGTGNIDSLCSLGGNRSIFLKYNSDASLLEWAKCLLLDGDTSLGYIFPTNDGGFVFGGNYNTSGWGMYICKQDALGNIVWSHGYSKGNDLYLSSMMATADGGYIMAGESSYVDTNSTIHYGSFTDDDIYVMKVDSTGNKVWGKVIGGTGDEYVKSVLLSANGGLYLIGTTYSDDYDCIGNHGAPDAYVARLDRDGNIIWHSDMGGTSIDNSSFAVADGRGGVMIGGTTYSNDGDVTHSFGTGGEIWVINVDSTGHILWNNCYGGGYETSNAICKATDGSIWIGGISSKKGGEVDTAYGNGDAWFVHADSGGDFLNAKVIGSRLDDRGMMIYPLSNGNVIVGGFYDTLGSAVPATYYGADDVFLAVFAPWNQTLIKQVTALTNEVKVYPNPAIEEVTIEAKNKGNYTILITDVFGRLIYDANFNEKIKITINSWQRGVYYVQVSGDKGYRSNNKLLVV